jgi:hypothetical protein
LFPEPLVGQAHLGSYICREWELRVTARCLEDDLEQPIDVAFEDLSGIEIIKTFMKDRFERIDDTRQVNKLKSGKRVWVLARGNDHRGGTWFDPAERVVWLLAYRRHRSGSPDDFFPYCQELDESGALWPTEEDYERLLSDRGSRFAWWVRIEGPVILKQAQKRPGEEHRVMFGGEYGACLAVEVADELQETTVAFQLDTVPTDHIPIILASIHADAAWEPTDKMPSRDLGPLELAFSHLREEPNG